MQEAEPPRGDGVVRHQHGSRLVALDPPSAPGFLGALAPEAQHIRPGQLAAQREEVAGNATTEAYRGVPIAGIALSVRRAATAPLLLEARSWRHGVYLAASLLSDRGYPSSPERLEHDPFGMVHDCGASMGDFIDQWFGFGRQLNVQPKIFCMNLGRIDNTGTRAWPGEGENARLLA